jgi:hypothetical protein
VIGLVGSLTKLRVKIDPNPYPNRIRQSLITIIDAILRIQTPHLANKHDIFIPLPQLSAPLPTASSARNRSSPITG